MRISKIRHMLHWIPRILSILYVFFLATFALDSKDIGIFVHLLPAAIVLVIAIFSWNGSYTGGVLFVLLAIASLFYFHTYDSLTNFSVLTLPLLVIGIFYGIGIALEER